VFSYCQPVLLEALNDGCIGRIARARTRVDDDVHGRQLVLVLPKRFADETFDPVAPDCNADDFRSDRQTEPRRRPARGASKDSEVRVGETARIAIDAIELGFVPEALRRCERPRGCVQARRTRAECFRR
jgi:hypothetical protein